MSEVKADTSTGEFSLVSVYCKKANTNMFIDLPNDIREGDSSITTLSYWFSDGRVRIEWTNASSTVPASFEAVVTVVNK